MGAAHSCHCSIFPEKKNEMAPFLFIGHDHYSIPFTDRMDFFTAGIKYFAASGRSNNALTFMAYHSPTSFRTTC